MSSPKICNICREVAINPVICLKCDRASCVLCIEDFLDTRHDCKCFSCRVLWDKEFIRENLSFDFLKDYPRDKNLISRNHKANRKSLILSMKEILSMINPEAKKFSDEKILALCMFLNSRWREGKIISTLPSSKDKILNLTYQVLNKNFRTKSWSDKIRETKSKRAIMKKYSIDEEKAETYIVDDEMELKVDSISRKINLVSFKTKIDDMFTSYKGYIKVLKLENV